MSRLILPDFMTTPHWERNESGISNSHPGYEVATCFECGREFIKGKTAGTRNCGHPDCRKV
jgi:hypothetical protein